MSRDRILVLGLGNLLMGDDGVGIHIVNEINRYNLSDHVEVIDGGATGIDLVEILSEYKRVIVVDAIRDKGKGPSQIRLISPADLILNDEGNDISLHDMELTSVLNLMKTLNMDIPEITIIGIPALNITPRIGLSEKCRKFVPEAVDLIYKLLRLTKPKNIYPEIRV